MKNKKVTTIMLSVVHGAYTSSLYLEMEWKGFCPDTEDERKKANYCLNLIMKI